MKHALTLLIVLAATGARAEQSILQIIEARKDFSTLRTLLKNAPDVKEVFANSKGPFTFYAPTDAAFAKLDARTKARVLDPKNAEATLLTHLTGGAWTIAKLKKANGEHVLSYTQVGFQVLVEAGKITLAGSPIIEGDKKATNGMVHVVSRPIVPPEGVRLALPVKKKDVPQANNAFQTSPIAAGAIAPNFVLKDLSGQPVALADALKGHRATLLYFWFVNCQPCREGMPDLDAMYKTLKDKGMGMLSINTADNASRAQEFLSQAGYSFPAVLNGAGPNDAAKKYLAWGVPTYVVVDEHRNVVDAFTGADKKRLFAAFEKAGLDLGELKP